MATRIITENLLRNKNLEVDFSDIPVTTYASNRADHLYDEIMSNVALRSSPNVVSFLTQKYMVYNIFYVFMAQGYFDDLSQLLRPSDLETLAPKQQKSCIGWSPHKYRSISLFHPKIHEIDGRSSLETG